MSGLWRQLDDFIAKSGHACLVTLLDAKGSSPREAGTRMIVRADGRFSGTIGGGALEWLALSEAQSLMRRHPEGGTLERTTALGPDLGQCCGGRVTLLFEVLAAGDRTWITPLIALEAHGPFSTIAARDARGIFRRICDDAGAGSPPIARIGDVLHETFGTTARQLLLFGAGHVGRALVLALAPLPFATRWIDSRKGEFPGAFPLNATPVLAADPASEIDAAASGTLLLAMTHSHALDLAIVSAGLRASNISFVGVIGSATKAARFRSQLRQAGYSETEAGRLVCPVGLAALRSKAPAIIAAGVAVQLLEVDQRMRDNAACPPATSNDSVAPEMAHQIQRRASHA